MFYALFHAAQKDCRYIAEYLDNLNDDGKEGWFLISFIPKVIENLKHITNILNSKLAYFSLHKLGWIVKKLKKIVYRLNRTTMLCIN